MWGWVGGGVCVPTGVWGGAYVWVHEAAERGVGCVPVYKVAEWGAA